MSFAQALLSRWGCLRLKQSECLRLDLHASQENGPGAPTEENLSSSLTKRKKSSYTARLR